MDYGMTRLLRSNVMGERRRFFVSGFLIAFLLCGWSLGTFAQNTQPTSEQMRIINQLPPDQRRQALDAIRKLQSRNQQESEQSNGSADSRPESSQSESDLQTTKDSENEGIPRAEEGSSLVITLLPKPDLTEEESKDIDADPALRQIVGSHYYQLDKSGVLLLPGLPDIPLLGLTADAIADRLGAEPALAPFDVRASILSTESIGASALEPFGYEMFQPDETEPDSASTGPVPTDYILGPGDVVRIQLFGNVNDSYELEITRDGSLNLPEIGPMAVAGLRYSEFRAEIDNRIQQRLIGTQVSVSMGSLRSIRIFVVGDVNRPGSYVVSSLATISSGLYRSGGISKIGSLRDVQLKRQGRLVASLDLYDLLLHGDTSDDAQLQQGDVILVPPIGDTVGIGGAVKRPAIYEAKGTLSLSDAVQLSGGLLPDAYPEGSTLRRIGAEKERIVLSIDLSSDVGKTIAIRNGDTLMVPEVLTELTGSVTLAGHVQRPGPREWQDGMLLTDLIPSLALLKPQADAGYVLIRREQMPGRKVTVLSADLESALNAPGSGEDLLLRARDTVFVFNLEFGRQRLISPILEELRLQAVADSPYEEVRVAGTIRAPGAYPLEEGMRVSDLIRAGGNLAEGAYLDEAELTRFTVVDDEARVKDVMVIDLEAALRGDGDADLLLSPYDHLRVSRVPEWDSDWTVSIEGEVKFPGEYQILRGESLRSVLERAGGLTDYAFPEGSIFLREELKEREREQLDILARRVESDLASMSLESLDSSGAEALSVGQTLLEQLRETEPVGRLVIDVEQVIASRDGTESSVELKDGDRLLVPGRSQEVTVVGEAQYPSSHLYKAHLTRDDYISYSGGLTRKADEKLIYVVRASGSVLSANRSVWFRRRGDIEIRPGDTIVVPVETDRVRPLTFWTNVSQIFYQTAIAIAAVRTFDN